MRRRIALLASVSTLVCLLLFAVPFVAYLRQSYLNDVDNLADVNAQMIASAVRANDSRNSDLLTFIEDEDVPEADAVVFIAPDALYGRSDACIERAGEEAAEGDEDALSWCGSRRVAARATTSADGAKAWVAVEIETSGQWHSLAKVAAISSLGLVLLPLVAVMIGERLGRSIVRPVDSLVEAADRVSAGDLAARVTPRGPSELERMGRTFNRLADRIQELVVHERETSADLSHRLRSPLTALMLRAEALSDPQESARMLSSVDRIQRELDDIIRQTRAPSQERVTVRCDLSAVVAERIAYWRALTDEQGRTCLLRGGTGSLMVGVGEADLVAVVDILVDNVLTHTPDGTAMTVEATEAGDAEAVLVVADSGPGMVDAVVERGRSWHGSSGLGLDIVRRTAENAGGSVRIGRSASGGTRVEVRLPLLP